MGCVHGKSCAAHDFKDCCCRCLKPSPPPSSSSSSSSPSSRGAASIGGDRLSRGRLRHVLSGAALGSVNVPSARLCLQYASFTQRGHYPDSPDSANQDSFCVRTSLGGNQDLHLFAVFDGHGAFGGQCAEFTRDALADALDADRNIENDPAGAFEVVFDATNEALHKSEIDDTMSGTTAIAVLVIRDTLCVANVGDSRAVAGVWNGETVVAEDLSSDQTPFRRDEYERVRRCGARVLSVDQVEGIKDPYIQNWGEEGNDDGDPPRLWVQDGMYPGTAFTRSVGDATAESIGVTAVPEVKVVKITPRHLFFVVASDGVFEFLSSQAVVNMVNKFDDPRDACSAIAAESYKLWLEHENRTDDITIIIVHIKDLCNSDDPVSEEANEDNKNISTISGKVKGENCLIPVSVHPKEENSNNLNSSPHDFPMEISSGVSLSPTNNDRRNVINPD